MEREERIALRTPLDASYRAAANVKSRRRLGLEPRRALWRDVREDFLALRCRVRTFVASSNETSSILPRASGGSCRERRPASGR